MQATKPTEALALYLSSLPTQTAVATSVQTLVRRLLLQTAHATEASHLLLGTSLTSLSIAHISSIAQGGGFFAHEEAQEEWSAAPISLDSSPERPAIRNVRVIRPLRDVGMKECGVWAWWRNLRIVGRDRYLAGKQGIGALTRGSHRLSRCLAVVCWTIRRFYCRIGGGLPVDRINHCKNVR